MKKILIAYFSHSGNTRVIAEQIHKIAGGDIFEIQTVKPYPDDYDATVEVAKKEQESDYRPELKTKLNDIKSYDMVFIGYPMWWYTIPMALSAFFETYDLSDKTIIPFCTHEGSGLSKSVGDIKKLCPRSNVLQGLAIRGGSVKSAQNELSAWLNKLGITR